LRSIPFPRPHSALSSARFLQRPIAAVALTAVTIGTGPAVGAYLPAASLDDSRSINSAKPIVFGASGGNEVAKLAHEVGAHLARHAFGHLKGPVPVARFINMQPDGPWRTIASARPGSSTYSNLIRWADVLKARGGKPILFSFSHEPEGSSSDHLGSAGDFIAAFRRIHDIFTARGVRVEYTWTMTSNSFRVPHGDDKYAAKWYPGDAYVDNVGSAAYNWYNCGEGSGRWLPLSDRAAAPLSFAKSRHKQLVLAEWASQDGPRRARWLKDARTWFLANKGSIRGAFYYQSPRPQQGCDWELSSRDDFKAFAAMADDRANFGG
jgi:Glycosyl hydrolase family 26